jgi:hypothetical protein
VVGWASREVPLGASFTLISGPTPRGAAAMEVSATRRDAAADQMEVWTFLCVLAQQTTRPVVPSVVHAYAWNGASAHVRHNA